MIRTPRLVLRAWRDDDLEPFAILNDDPRVMEFLPKRLDRAESDALAGRIRADQERQGFGLWGVEITGGPSFVGFVGLSVPKFDTLFTPCIEIGWRLAFEQWGKGYATEAARAVIEYGFETLGLTEIVSFTVPANVRSWRVMERLGMTRSPGEDFDHPRLDEGHPLRRHILYRLPRWRWERNRSQPGTATGTVFPNTGGLSPDVTSDVTCTAQGK